MNNGKTTFTQKHMFFYCETSFSTHVDNIKQRNGIHGYEKVALSRFSPGGPGLLVFSVFFLFPLPHFHTSAPSPDSIVHS